MPAKRDPAIVNSPRRTSRHKAEEPARRLTRTSTSLATTHDQPPPTHRSQKTSSSVKKLRRRTVEREKSPSPDPLDDWSQSEQNATQSSSPLTSPPPTQTPTPSSGAHEAFDRWPYPASRTEPVDHNQPREDDQNDLGNDFERKAPQAILDLDLDPDPIAQDTIYRHLSPDTGQTAGSSTALDSLRNRTITRTKKPKGLSRKARTPASTPRKRVRGSGRRFSVSPDPSDQGYIPPLSSGEVDGTRGIETLEPPQSEVSPRHQRATSPLSSLPSTQKSNINPSSPLSSLGTQPERIPSPQPDSPRPSSQENEAVEADGIVGLEEVNQEAERLRRETLDVFTNPHVIELELDVPIQADPIDLRSITAAIARAASQSPIQTISQEEFRQISPGAHTPPVISPGLDGETPTQPASRPVGNPPHSTRVKEAHSANRSPARSYQPALADPTDWNSFPQSRDLFGGTATVLSPSRPPSPVLLTPALPEIEADPNPLTVGEDQDTVVEPEPNFESEAFPSIGLFDEQFLIDIKPPSGISDPITTQESQPKVESTWQPDQQVPAPFLNKDITKDILSHRSPLIEAGSAVELITSSDIAAKVKERTKPENQEDLNLNLDLKAGSPVPTEEERAFPGSISTLVDPEYVQAVKRESLAAAYTDFPHPQDPITVIATAHIQSPSRSKQPRKRTRSPPTRAPRRSLRSNTRIDLPVTVTSLSPAPSPSAFDVTSKRDKQEEAGSKEERNMTTPSKRPRRIASTPEEEEPRGSTVPMTGPSTPTSLPVPGPAADADNTMDIDGNDSPLTPPPPISDRGKAAVRDEPRSASPTPGATSGVGDALEVGARPQKSGGKEGGGAAGKKGKGKVVQGGNEGKGQASRGMKRKSEELASATADNTATKIPKITLKLGNAGSSASAIASASAPDSTRKGKGGAQGLAPQAVANKGKMKPGAGGDSSFDDAILNLASGTASATPSAGKSDKRRKAARQSHGTSIPADTAPRGGPNDLFEAESGSAVEAPAADTRGDAGAAYFADPNVTPTVASAPTVAPAKGTAKRKTRVTSPPHPSISASASERTTSPPRRHTAPTPPAAPTPVPVPHQDPTPPMSAAPTPPGGLEPSKYPVADSLLPKGEMRGKGQADDKPDGLTGRWKKSAIGNFKKAQRIDDIAAGSETPKKDLGKMFEGAEMATPQSQSGGKPATSGAGSASKGKPKDGQAGTTPKPSTAPNQAAGGGSTGKKPAGTPGRPAGPRPSAGTPTAKPAGAGLGGMSSLLSSTMAHLKHAANTPKADNTGKAKKEQPKAERRYGRERYVMTPTEQKEWEASAGQRAKERARRDAYGVGKVNLQEAKDAYKLDAMKAGHRALPFLTHMGIHTEGLPQQIFRYFFGNQPHRVKYEEMQRKAVGVAGTTEVNAGSGLVRETHRSVGETGNEGGMEVDVPRGVGGGDDGAVEAS